MGSQSTIIGPDVLRSINAASLNGVYDPVGAPLPSGVRIVKFTNDSTVGVFISWDGVIDHEILPPGSFVLLDVTSNRESSTDSFEIPRNTQFYVRGAAGTGFIYISTYLGK